MPAWVLASATFGLAAGLLPAPRRRIRARGGLVVLPLLALAVVAFTAPLRLVALVVAAAVMCAGGALLWRRRAERLAAARTGARLVDVCEQLAAELTAGRPPGHALASAAADWSVLGPVAEAARVGADVPDALRRAAREPGADGLRWVAAAWQVAHRTGQGLAAAVDRVAVDLREQQATRRVVDGELASARATAKLVALLPLAALAMGSGVGGDPWRFLLGTPVGIGCLLVGLLAGWLGLWWIEAITRGAESP
jgi:tight adherence protein B